MSAAPAMAQSDPPRLERAEAGPENLTAARAYIYTIVTPDMAASTRFYRDVMGNELIDEGALDSKLPTMSGVGKAGRRYALFRHKEKVQTERGVIRLLEAGAGAPANRPRGRARIVDPGLAIIECHPPRDWLETYLNLTRNGVETVAKPIHYVSGSEFMAYSAFGPAGEQMFMACAQAGPMTVNPNHDGLYGPFVQSTVMTWDRWPMWAFYDAMFGVKPTGDEFIAQESINTMIGAPKGTYFHYSGMGGRGAGQGLRMEWWEFRQWQPTGRPLWPTDLDKTGLAMTSILVENLAVVRDRARAAKIKILGEGALPTPGGKGRDGFYVRGSEGELIEVIGRT